MLNKLLLPARLLVAFWQSLRAILQRRPDVVLGMGGYTAFPGGMMASLLNRPLVIHEQNSVGGLTNRVLACLADRVLTAFPKVFTHAHDKPIPCRRVATEWVGNPVRADIAAIPAGERAARTGPLRLLVVGGSLGAQALNERVPQALALLPAGQRPLVVHQSGREHLDVLRANYAAAGVEAEVRDYIEDMASEYQACDFAICRAGAMTVAESIHTGKDMKVSDRMLNRLKAMSEGLLGPKEIRRIRKKLRLSQETAGLLIGGGPRAFQKYESGDLLPSRAVSSALVLLDYDPGALAVLKRRHDAHHDSVHSEAVPHP